MSHLGIAWGTATCGSAIWSLGTETPTCSNCRLCCAGPGHTRWCPWWQFWTPFPLTASLCRCFCETSNYNDDVDNMLYCWLICLPQFTHENVWIRACRMRSLPCFITLLRMLRSSHCRSFTISQQEYRKNWEQALQLIQLIRHSVETEMVIHHLILTDVDIYQEERINMIIHFTLSYHS